jgi:hypothetical protein
VIHHDLHNNVVLWWHGPKGHFWQSKPEGCLNKERLGDASIVRLKKVFEGLLVWESIGRKDGSPKGMYNIEGDAQAWT